MFLYRIEKHEYQQLMEKKFSMVHTSEMGEPVVVINLDDQGKDIFCTITAANIGKPMAIFVGGNLLTAPNIQSKIC